MTEPSPAPQPEPKPPRAMTVRAIVIGVLAVIAFAVATPFNDWMLGNTYFYCHYLPPGVTILVLLIGLFFNPLLGRHRLRTGELVVIVSMLLVLGGVASSGLMRVYPQVVTGPAKLLPLIPNFAPLGPRAADGDKSIPEDTVLPARMFVALPEHGPIPTSDPDYRLVIDGFYDGMKKGDPTVSHRAQVTWKDAQGTHIAQALGGIKARQQPEGASFLDLGSDLGKALAGKKAGQEVSGPQGPVQVVAVQAPGVPWDAWIGPFINWIPLFGGAFVCCLAIAALVRRQWIDHERLPYPIANLTFTYMQEPEPGRRLAPIFRQRGFWIGFAVAMVILITQGLKTWNVMPFAIPTDWDLTTTFTGDWQKVYQSWSLYHPRLHFSVAALIFFLPLDLSFSLWFFFILTNVVYYLLTVQGVPINNEHISTAGVGGFAMECVLILWIGRKYYGQVLKAAVVGAKDPELRAVAPYVWCLLAGMAGMAATMVALGALVQHALIVVLVFLGLILVMARLVAEAGIPFIQSPVGFFMTQIVFSITGFHASLAALAPLTLLGSTLLCDTRENLLPYAVQAEYLGHRTKVPRMPLSALMLSVVALGTVICGIAMVLIYYKFEHSADGWPHGSLQWNNLQVMIDGWSAGDNNPKMTTIWMGYGVGAGLVAVLGVGRLLFSAWPFHPLGYLVSMSYPTMNIWFGFFVGWLAKALVMRYGGTTVYQRLKPVAMGLIAGEAIATGVFLLTKVILYLGNIKVANAYFLPQ
jgi:hypothetical protein